MPKNILIIVLVLLLPLAFWLGLTLGQKQAAQPPSPVSPALPLPDVLETPEFATPEVLPVFTALKVSSISQDALNGVLLSDSRFLLLSPLEGTPLEGKTQLTASLAPNLSVSRVVLTTDPQVRAQLKKFAEAFQAGQSVSPDQILTTPPPSPITAQIPAKLTDIKPGDTVVVGVAINLDSPQEFQIISLNLIENPEAL